MDAVDPLDKLLTIGDTGDGWRVVCRLLEAFEHSGCTSLKRPIKLGVAPGPNSLNTGSPRHHYVTTSYLSGDKLEGKLEVISDFVTTKTGCVHAVMTRKPCI